MRKEDLVFGRDGLSLCVFRDGVGVRIHDVDILVDVDPSIGLDFVSLADRIEELLGTSVDVVSTRALKARNRDSIERDVLYV